MKANTETEESKTRRPGRPSVEDGRNVTKCFRLKEDTAIKLDALMKHFGKKEGKKTLSIGRTLEILISKEYYRAFQQSFSEDEDVEAALTIDTPLPDDVILPESPTTKKTKSKKKDPYSSDNYESFPTSSFSEQYDEWNILYKFKRQHDCRRFLILKK